MPNSGEGHFTKYIVSAMRDHSYLLFLHLVTVFIMAFNFCKAPNVEGVLIIVAFFKRNEVHYITIPSGE